MGAVVITPKYKIFSPSASLRDYVSYYWLSLDNPDMSYMALPDGAVDLVIQVCATGAETWVYGTTTARTDILVNQQCHYLGIRFKPGQSRYFMTAAAHELTDGYELSQGLLRFSLDDVFKEVACADVANYLDRLLENYLIKWQPVRHRIDDIIGLIESNSGTLSIREAAASFGKSRRQFERVFLQTVGVSAKFFSLITRFRRAASLIVSPAEVALAEVAAATGYADQSHMSHEFKRLINMSPAQFARDAREHVAFLQDLTCAKSETRLSK